VVYEAANQFIASHPEQYAYLFDDGLEQDSTTAVCALTGLLRSTRVSGTSKREQQDMPYLKNNIQAILRLSQYGQLDEAHNFLEGAPDAKLPPFLDATVRIVHRWRKAAIRNARLDAFENLTTGRQADSFDVVDITPPLLTIAALLSVTENRHKKVAGKLPLWAINGIGKYGPRFTAGFIDGRETTATAVSLSNLPFLYNSTPAERKVILGSPGDIVGRMAKSYSRLADYSDSLIALATGWDSERIATVFTENRRRRLALNNPDQDPENLVASIARAYDYLSDTDKLAVDLDMTPRRVRAFFPDSYLQQTIFSSPQADPLSVLRRALRVTSHLTHNYGLPYNIARTIGLYMPERCESQAKLILEQEGNRPPDIEPSLWMYVIIRNPDSYEKRLAAVAEHRAHWDVARAISLDKGYSDSGRTQKDYWVEPTYSPETVLFGQDELAETKKYVEKLIATAKLATDEKERLLTFFSSHHEQRTPEIDHLLNRLRAASSA
jgi:hypothetical protein